MGSDPMRDRYEPSTDPEPWPAVQPAYPAWRAGEEYAGPDWDPYYPAEFGGPADEARHQGLRRLSRLTWQATGLSATFNHKSLAKIPTAHSLRIGFHPIESTSLAGLVFWPSKDCST